MKSNQIVMGPDLFQDCIEKAKDEGYHHGFTEGYDLAIKFLTDAARGDCECNLKKHDYCVSCTGHESITLLKGKRFEVILEQLH